MSTNESIALDANAASYSAKFIVLLALEIPSSIISSIILIDICLTPAFRSNVHNRSMCMLLAFNFLQIMADLPITISFYRSGGTVRPATPAFCTWWIWFEFALNGITIDLMAWLSIKRHLLIFHSNFMRALRPWQRWSIQNSPLFVCSLWGPLFALVTVVISPVCTNAWIFDSLLCGLPCYLMTNWGTYDLLINITAPVSIILIANTLLILRIIARKALGIQRNAGNRQQRQRKMVIQLLTVSTLYLSIWLPLCIVQLGQIFFNPTFLADWNDMVNFLLYVIPSLLPFACFMSRPEIMKKMKAFVQEKLHVAVIPI
jgi:hypothetical protein